MLSGHRRWLVPIVLVVVGMLILISPLALGVLHRPTATETVVAFRDAGLSLSPTRDMGLAQWGYAPQLADEALYFDIWTYKDCICSVDPVGYVMSFKRRADLVTTVAYYQAVSQETPLFAKWAISSGNLLLVLPGTLPMEQIEPYAQVMAELAGSPYTIE